MSRSPGQPELTQTPIAIIGMGCLFPSAEDLTGFWRLMRGGTDGIGDVPPAYWQSDAYYDPDPKRPDMTYCKRGGFLAPTAFDPIEFGIPPNAIEATDTAQLLGLIVAKRAMEDAGYGDERSFDRERTSVILGVTGTLELALSLGARLGHPIWRKALREAGVPADVAEDVVARIADGYVPWQESSFPGLLGNVVAGRIANRLNLRGTNCVVDAACASASSAIHLSVLELSTGRADMVLTGGVDTLNDIFMFMCFSKTPALSPTGDARPFSADADGTVIGEGVGMVLLKRLDDAVRDRDRIYAVIRAVGSSSDGRSQSIYAPHSAGQARALRNAYQLAGVDPSTVELVEAHGTGTRVGDAVEFEALKTVFREARAEGSWCGVGSIKSQIGHTKAAAGAAGLIKAALAVYYRVLPPTLKVSQPNPKLGVEKSPFYLNATARPWVGQAGQPRRAGVSSFGFGGSNFHIVIEEAPTPQREPAWDGTVQIIAISADSREELTSRAEQWRTTLRDTNWNDPAVTGKAAASRRMFSTDDAFRLVLVLDQETDAGALLDQVLSRLVAPTGLTGPQAAVESALAPESLAAAESSAVTESPVAGWTMPNACYGEGAVTGKIAALFPGQGSQYIDMGLDLACVFPEMLDALAEADRAGDDAGNGAAIRTSSGTRDAIRGGASNPIRSSASDAIREATGGSTAALSDAIYPRTAYHDADRAQRDQALTRTDMAQPALGAVAAGMFSVLRRFGFEPHLAAGHSFGELVALWAGDRMDAAALHRLARLRGRLMAGGGGDRGTMLVVHAPLHELDALIKSENLDVVLANRNTPDQGVLSGPTNSIEHAAALCKQRGFRTQRLAVSAAFHSPLMDDARPPFLKGLRAVEFRRAPLPVYSTVTAGPYPDDVFDIPELLAGQLTQPVRFMELVENLYEAGARTFVEIGPRAVLTGLVGKTLANRPVATMALDASNGRRSGIADLARLLAGLAAAGHRVDLTRWERPHAPRRAAKMSIPLIGANYRSTPPAARPARAPIQQTSTAPAILTSAVLPQASPSPLPSAAVPPRTSNVSPSSSRVSTPGTQSTSQSSAGAPSSPPSQIPSPSTTAANTQPPRAARSTEPTPNPLPEAPRPSHPSAVSQSAADAAGAARATTTQTQQASPRSINRPQQVAGPKQMENAMNHEPNQAAPPSSPDVVPGTACGQPAASRASSLPSAVTPAVADAMRVVEQGLQAMQALQQQTAAAHQRFLEGQEQAQRTFQQLIASQQRLLLGGSILEMHAAPPASVPPATVDATSAPFAATPAPAAPAQVSPPTGAPIAPVQAPPVVAPITPVQTPPVVAPITPVPTSPVAAAYTAPVSQPAPAPNAAPAPPAAPTTHAAHAPPVAAAPPIIEPAVPADLDGLVLDIVSEKTGYPREMLELDMDIEADLGIDSIKRVEIIASIEERSPGLAAVAPDQMGSVRTLRRIIELMSASTATGHGGTAAPRSTASPSTSAAPSPSPAATPNTAATHTTQATLPPAANDHDEMASVLLAVVADLTGYPADMLNLDMDLEADLGIDSIKRVEILAAVETRAPQFKSVDPEYLGSLRTLRQIVDHSATSSTPTGQSSAPSSQPPPTSQPREATLQASASSLAPDHPGLASGPPDSTTAPANFREGARLPDAIERRVLECAHLHGAEAAGRLGVRVDRTICVTDDGAGLSDALVRELQARGHAARVVAGHRDVLKIAPDRLGGLICLAPPLATDHVTSDDADSIVTSLFETTRAAAPGLAAAANQGGAFFATVSRLDGGFGLLGSGSHHPVLGAIAGLAKTAAHEWPAVRCRALDVASDWDDVDTAARVIADELADLDAPIEIGLNRLARRGLTLHRRVIETCTPAFDAGDVVVITGGARGVAAEAAVALAERYQPTLVLLGRSPMPADEPDWLAGVTDPADIKRRILAREFPGSVRPTPAELETVYRRHMANREVRRTLGRIEATGARAVYYSVDVRNASTVASVLGEVRSHLGPIRGVIHAAGVIEDRRIADKTVEQFREVFDTKVVGLRNLLLATDRDVLKAICLFSSVSARFGNAGQSDYASANEAMNKIAHRLAATRPDCRVVSINWGPWDGGMVGPDLRRAFECRGIELIPLAAGAQAMLDELDCDDHGAVEVVLGAGFESSTAGPPAAERPAQAPARGAAQDTTATPACATPATGAAPRAIIAAAPRDETLTVAFERELDRRRHPFLASHEIGGRPILPVAIIMEWMGHAALHANPGLKLIGLDGLRLLKGVALSGQTYTVRLAAGRIRAAGSQFEVNVELRGGHAGATEAIHARAVAILAVDFPQPAPFQPPADWAMRPYAGGVDAAYGDVLFHGRHFRAIEQIDGVADAGMIARVASAPAPCEWMTDALRSDWLGDPLIVDAAFQMAILWCQARLGMVSLPTYFERYRQYAPSFPAAGVTAVLRVLDHGRHRMRADIDFADADGRLVARIEGYECAMDPTLRDAFRGRIASDAGA